MSENTTTPTAPSTAWCAMLAMLGLLEVPCMPVWTTSTVHKALDAQGDEGDDLLRVSVSTISLRRIQRRDFSESLSRIMALNDDVDEEGRK